ncbi:MAG: DNA polymerase III subunit delta, partial [Chloroflexota bacterium]
MSENPPVVYLLHGEDEYAITQFVATLVAKLGDPVMADLNVARLDGRSISLEDLETATHTLPFLVKRRLVVLTNPLARLNSPIARKKFLTQLDHVPPTVALVLIEYRILTEERDRKKGQIQWLEKWALEGGERVYTKAFPLPQGQAMTRRIQEMAKAAGGQISHQAADLLGSLVGENPRAADQEIQKLLAYADYRRTVEVEDVEHLTADQGHGDIFALVDAIGNRDGRKAQNMLHRLLSEQDALSIYGMVVRQFR